MAYSREELTREKTFGETQIIVQDLLDKMLNGTYLTVFEGRYICGKFQLFQSTSNVPVPNALDFDICNDCIFMDKYLIYFNNYEGFSEQLGPFGIISLSDKISDIAFLNIHYLTWNRNVVENTRLKDELLRHIQIETYRQLKSLKEYCRQIGYGNNYYNHSAKGIVLHSKFLYITILEYYQDGNAREETIEICNRKIIIDSYSYVHILFRHYAAQAKEHQKDKSYHSFGDFDHKRLPKEILQLLFQYSNIVDCNNFDEEKVFFKRNNTLYALWLKKAIRKIKGRAQETIFRVETLYPVIVKRDLDKIAQLNIIQVSNNLYFYQ